ncbi:MAG TPA: hypothetical protein VGD79_12820 [Thermoanaerobaculia bacterium]
MLAVFAVAAGVLGLHGLDRTLVARSMAPLRPPRTPAALHALLYPPKIEAPPPPAASTPGFFP